MEELNPKPFDRQLFEITRTDRQTDREQTGNHLNCRSTGSREPCAKVGVLGLLGLLGLLTRFIRIIRINY